MGNDDRWQQLAQAMRREVAQHFPEWTDSNTHDPGITLLELFAWTAETLHHTPGMATPEVADAARRLSRAARALENSGGRMEHGGLQRVNYFSGQLLTAEDFRDEQDYFRRRLRRLNRALHGVGVVRGLGISIDSSGDAPRVVIEPGLALDPCGEEIEVSERVSLPLPAEVRRISVQLRFVERPVRPVQVSTAGDGQDDTEQYSRILETCEVRLALTEDTDAVTLARLRHTRTHWSVEHRPTHT